MLKAAVGSADTEEDSSRKSPRIMVVEDNPTNRALLCHYLKSKKIETIEARDGEEAVNLFEAKPQGYFDIILMDISMPKMDGNQATRAIRKIEASRRDAPPSEIPVATPIGTPLRVAPTAVVQARTKIFALTGLATQDDKREAFAGGVDGYLVKPVSFVTIQAIFTKIGY